MAGCSKELQSQEVQDRYDFFNSRKLSLLKADKNDLYSYLIWRTLQIKILKKRVCDAVRPLEKQFA